MGVHTGSTTADITAWVSAGAAVVQAIGAILAIVYSVKLARDAATREIKADEANARRIAEAAAAAEYQRRIDREAEASRLRQAETQRFNQPLDLVIEMADRALNEMLEKQSEAVGKAAQDQKAMYWVSAGPVQNLLMERLPSLTIESGNVEVAAALRSTQDAFAPFSGNFPLDANEWMPLINGKLSGMRAAIEALQALRR